jgi:hypothetical protein
MPADQIATKVGPLKGLATGPSPGRRVFSESFELDTQYVPAVAMVVQLHQYSRNYWRFTATTIWRILALSGKHLDNIPKACYDEI